MSKYQELGCERCKNRRRSIKSRQGEYCSAMMKSDKTTCEKFKLDPYVRVPLCN